jgi:branched-chain amino acid transport system substrate-binding protein
VFPAYSAVGSDRRRHQGRQVRRHRQGGCRHPRRTFKTPTGDLSFDAKGDLDFKFVVYEWHFGKPKTEVSLSNCVTY